MPKPLAPLLSFRASGKVGGRRRGRRRKVSGLSQITVLASKDTYIQADAPNDNFGQVDRVFVRAIPFPEIKTQVLRTLLNFDISQLRPGTVATATLTLEALTASFSPTATLFRLERQATWTTLGATWVSYDDPAQWTTLGGDFVTVDPPSVPWTLPGAAGIFIFPDITPNAQKALDDLSGLVSIILLLDDEDPASDQGTAFASTRHATAQAPTLEVVMA